MRAIPLWKFGVVIGEAIVDDHVYEITEAFRWGINLSGYARRGIRDTDGSFKDIFLHHVVLPKKDGFQVDHIDCNKLNDQSSNLRYCTFSQNRANQHRQKNNASGHKGVSWFVETGKWRVQIAVNGRKISLGYFTEITEAANAYKIAARKYFGEFSRAE